jgi:hypothetical protein
MNESQRWPFNHPLHGLVAVVAISETRFRSNTPTHHWPATRRSELSLLAQPPFPFHLFFFFSSCLFGTKTLQQEPDALGN